MTKFINNNLDRPSFTCFASIKDFILKIVTRTEILVLATNFSRYRPFLGDDPKGYCLLCDSGNFKKYGAFGESSYSIIPHHSGESGNSDTGDTGDSEKPDDFDYFCTLGDSGISEVLSLITVHLTDLVIVVHLVWGVKNVNF